MESPEPKLELLSSLSSQAAGADWTIPALTAVPEGFHGVAALTHRDGLEGVAGGELGPFRIVRVDSQYPGGELVLEQA